MLDCRCNGETTAFGQGGKCTDGEYGRWCFVDEHACKNRKAYDGKFSSRTPCKSEPNPDKPCVCNGKKDGQGLGGSCKNGGIWCYVDRDANCTDIALVNGKPASRNACKVRKTNKGKEHKISYFSVQSNIVS